MTNRKYTRRATRTNVGSPVWGKNELRELKRIEAKLPEWARPKLRQIKRSMTTGTREGLAFARLSRELCAIFRSVCPKLNSALLGRTVARFLDSLHYADALSVNLREITRIKGRSRRERIRSILLEIKEVALDGQRRQVEGLRRDVPLLLKQLDADEPHKRKQ